MCVNKGVADEDTVLIGDENLLPLENHTAHAKGVRWQSFAVIFAYVLVPVGTEYIALILVNAQVKRRTMLNNGFIKR